MEIKMVSCPNGHYYNAAIHKTCPDCARDLPPTGFRPTVDPRMSSGAAPREFSLTQDPHFGRSISTNSNVDNIGTGSIGKTVSADRSGASEEYGVTVIGGDFGGDPDDRSTSVDPVVGWLVCVEGPCRGVDFRIHAGYNYIGRENGDICLDGDNQISRQNHAMIAYDSADHSYYFGPSGGRNLVRVNGKTILNAVDIHNYDVLTIGGGKYLFVALCGSHFGWNEGLAHE